MNEKIAGASVAQIGADLAMEKTVELSGQQVNTALGQLNESMAVLGGYGVSQENFHKALSSQWAGESGREFETASNTLDAGVRYLLLSLKQTASELSSIQESLYQKDLLLSLSMQGKGGGA